jgi:hypothetical protein
MFTLQKSNAYDNILELHAAGTLTDADYRRLVPELSAMLQPGQRQPFLVVLENFHGWQPAALMDELKFDLKFRDRIGPVAVVGTKSWERWGVTLSSLLFSSEVRSFGSRDEALAWLREQAASTPAGSR